MCTTYYPMTHGVLSFNLASLTLCEKENLLLLCKRGAALGFD